MATGKMRTIVVAWTFTKMALDTRSSCWLCLDKTLKNPKFMKWTFTCQGLTLPLDGSKDSEMDLQCMKKGVPEGMFIENPVSAV